jgi:hypothetical protein
VPISYSISHAARMVVASGEGDISVSDLQDALMAVMRENAMPYAKLIDLTFAPLTLRHAGIRAAAERVKQFNQGRQVGPLAVVLNSELAREIIELFDSLVEADRPIGIFEDLDGARAWLRGLGYPADNRPTVNPSANPS